MAVQKPVKICDKVSHKRTCTKSETETDATRDTNHMLPIAKILTNNTSDDIAHAREIRHLSERFKLVQKVSTIAEFFSMN